MLGGLLPFVPSDGGVTFVVFGGDEAPLFALIERNSASLVACDLVGRILGINGGLFPCPTVLNVSFVSGRFTKADSFKDFPPYLHSTSSPAPLLGEAVAADEESLVVCYPPPVSNLEVAADKLCRQSFCTFLHLFCDSRLFWLFCKSIFIFEVCRSKNYS